MNTFKLFVGTCLLGSALFCAPASHSAQPAVPFPTQTVESVTGLSPEARAKLGPAPGFVGYYLAGRHAQMEQDWQKARFYLDLVTAKDPGNLELRRRAMVVAMGSGHLDMASYHAEKLIASVPDDTLAHLFTGVRYLETEHYDDALKSFASMPKGGMTNFAVPLLQTWTYAAEHKLELTDLPPDSLNAYHAALAARMLGKQADVADFLQRVQETSGGTPTLKLADAFLIQGDIDTARKLYITVQGLTGPNDAIKRRLAFIDSKPAEGDLPFIAPKTAQEGLALAFLDMSRILYAQNSLDSARVFGQISLQFDPDNTEANILMAQVYLDAGRPEDAIAQYKKIEKTNPFYTEVQLELARILEDMGAHDRAAQQLNAFHSESGNREAQIMLGDLYRRNGNYTEALRAYDAVAASFKDKVPENYWFLLYARGMVQERLNAWEKAEADLKTALAYRPDDPYILNYLAYGWTDRNQHLSKALEYLEKAASLRPTDGHIRDSLGWALFKMGRFEDSVDPLEKAITYLPYDATVNDHLGDAYWQVGRQREARFQWQRALNNIESTEGHETLISQIKQKLLGGLPAAAPRLQAARNEIGESKIE